LQTKSSADKPSIGMKKGTFFLLILIGFLLLGSSSVLPPFPNVGVLQIQHPEAFDRIFAISDVHGMLPHLKDLLQANHIITGDGDWSAGNSLLIIVGDSVDKGPDSLGVLALWEKLALQTTNAGVGRVVHLLGNHEAEFLADPEGDRTADFRDELKSHSLFDQALNPQTTLGGMLRSMPVAARVGNWLFCHAGFIPI
jgi:hypothetical protein